MAQWKKKTVPITPEQWKMYAELWVKGVGSEDSRRQVSDHFGLGPRDEERHTRQHVHECRRKYLATGWAPMKIRAIATVPPLATPSPSNGHSEPVPTSIIIRGKRYAASEVLEALPLGTILSRLSDSQLHEIAVRVIRTALRATTLQDEVSRVPVLEGTISRLSRELQEVRTTANRNSIRQTVFGEDSLTGRARYKRAHIGNQEGVSFSLPSSELNITTSLCAHSNTPRLNIIPDFHLEFHKPFQHYIMTGFSTIGLGHSSPCAN